MPAPRRAHLALLVLTALASLGSAWAQAALVVDVDLAKPAGAIRDVFGANRRPGFASRTPGLTHNAASLYAAFGLSQVRLHDSGLDHCPIYTAASKLNTAVDPAQAVAGCELAGSGSVPTFTWTPLSSADADLNNTANYDFSAADTALQEVLSSGAATYLRLGESYNGPNNTGDPVAWAKVATNIYKHVVGTFKPTAGAAALNPVFVEVHNEPDGGFWRGTQADFFTLFRETVTRVRAAAAASGKTLRIGGPGFTRSILTSSTVSGNPANGFIAGVGLANLDFYSAHLYGSCATATLGASAAFLRSLRSLVNGQGGSSLPIHITEWNIGLGNQCGNDLFAEPRMQSFTSGVLTQFQDPAQNIEAAHFYSAVPIMALFDFTSVSGKVRINPSAWSFWAHGRLRGATQLSTQVCQGSSCLAGYAAETLPVLALGAQKGDATTVILSNDSSSAQTLTLRLRGLSASSVNATLTTPPGNAQGLSTTGSPTQADAAALAALLASPTQDRRSALAVSGGVLELSTSVPARGLQLIELKPVATVQQQADCLFSWGERQYAALFQPAPQTSQTAGDYYYRYYPTTNSYVGITLSQQHLVYLDARAGAAIQDLGPLSSWLATAGCS